MAPSSLMFFPSFRDKFLFSSPSFSHSLHEHFFLFFFFTSHFAAWPAGWKESLVYLSRCPSRTLAFLVSSPSNCSRSWYWLPVLCVWDREQLLVDSVEDRQTHGALTAPSALCRCQSLCDWWSSVAVAHLGEVHLRDKYTLPVFLSFAVRLWFLSVKD